MWEMGWRIGTVIQGNIDGPTQKLSTKIIIFIVGIPDDCTHGELRLVSTQSSALEGTVQICAYGYWGMICSTVWNSRDAYVACKQLGYPTLGNMIGHMPCCIMSMTLTCLGSIALQPHYFYSNNGWPHIMEPIWLDSVQCHGNESSIISCSHGGLGVTLRLSTCNMEYNHIGLLPLYRYSMGARVQCVGKCRIWWRT